MEYEIIIGLEVHAQLKTESKIFCSCSTNFGAEPNSQVCPICLGMPGVLPVLNKKAVEYAIKMGFATHCKIASHSIFARKNYFYPDLPKGYQISQFETPVCENGFIEMETNGSNKQIGITRIHLEEDAGKSIHTEDFVPDGETLVDLNRCGVPLIEIVSEPEIKSPKEASHYLAGIKQILEYLGISDCSMEEGSLRCDANISIRPLGSKKLGTKTELKNMNSFKAVEKALEFEAERQRELIKNGQEVVQQTLLWNADENRIVPMRTKEEADDYRYFPEPDLVPMAISPEWIESQKSEIPELPFEKKNRFVQDYKLPEYDAEVLVSSRILAEFFEQTQLYFKNPKAISNFIMGEVLRYLGDQKISIDKTKLSPKNLADLLDLVEKGTINLNVAKSIFPEMIKNGTEAKVIIKKRGLAQVSDESFLKNIVLDVIQSNPSELEKYLSGKDKLFGFFVGQIMRATKGKGNPKVINQLLREELNKKKEQV